MAASTNAMPAPSGSMRCISRYGYFKCWRITLPKGLGGGQTYFNDSDYGGEARALLEARYFHDERFEAVGLPVMARVNITADRLARGETLAVYERRGARGTMIVRGHWMETVQGKPRQRVVQRSCATHGTAEARRQVQEIVRAAVANEAARLARAEVSGTLGQGDGAVGSRRLRKAG